jgi:hypothetical protein
MTPRRTKALRRRPQPAEPLRVQNPHAAGIDVHAAQHGVAVTPQAAPPPPIDHPPHLPPHVRKFGACTADREALADWLAACGVATVAMESTGVYGIPLFELLERRGFQASLVDPRQTRQVSGRPKTDVLDCQWIQRLHSYGLLAASFRPEDQVVVLRGYLAPATTASSGSCKPSPIKAAAARWTRSPGGAVDHATSRPSTSATPCSASAAST